MEGLQKLIVQMLISHALLDIYDEAWAIRKDLAEPDADPDLPAGISV